MAKATLALKDSEAKVVRNPAGPLTVIASARSGSVLLLVLVVIAMMALGTGTYMVMMHNEHVAARYSGSRLQARLQAESGAEFLKLFLAQSATSISSKGGLFENITWMQAQLVADDPVVDFRGRFSVVCPAQTLGYYEGYRFGLEDESAKLNLNSLVEPASGSTSAAGGSGGASGNSGSNSGSSGQAAENQRELSPEEEARYRLMALPGMTEDIADAILDWIDEDDQPRAYGAEESYYMGLTPAYRPRNGPLTSLDELLLVRGVTPELLYGIDSNRNYVLETSETPRGAVALVDNYNGQMSRGWAAYLTLFGMELLDSPDGEEKFDLNSRDLEQLYDDLNPLVGADEAKFIVLYRQYGPADEDAEGSTTSVGSFRVDFDKEASTEIGSVLDLVGVNVPVQENEQAPVQLIASPWQDAAGTAQSLLELMDYAHAQPDSLIKGRVNVNQASRAVLLSIPVMTETMADQIIGSRVPNVDPVYDSGRHAIWLWSEGILDLEEMKEIEPYVTAGGDVYSCQIAGYFEAAPMQSRVHVVLDRTGSTVEALQWEDWGHLGPGFLQATLMGIESTDPLENPTP